MPIASCCPERRARCQGGEEKRLGGNPPSRPTFMPAWAVKSSRFSACSTPAMGAMRAELKKPFEPWQQRRQGQRPVQLYPASAQLQPNAGRSCRRQLRGASKPRRHKPARRDRATAARHPLRRNPIGCVQPGLPAPSVRAPTLQLQQRYTIGWRPHLGLHPPKARRAATAAKRRFTPCRSIPTSPSASLQWPQGSQVLGWHG